MKIIILDPGAVRWCVRGAMVKCNTLFDTEGKLLKYIITNTEYITIAQWNDASSYEEVIAVLKELDI